jgi:hypothetical protein
MIEPLRAPRMFTHLLILAALAAPSFGSAPKAAELLPAKTTDRKYPQGVFCPLPLELKFVADGPSATLRFSTTTVNYLDSNNGNTWAQQQLDNICVSTEDVYEAHRGPLGPYSDACYISPGPLLTETFYFQDAGTIPLKETFDSDPTISGWNLSGGAYWESASTAPNDPGSDLSFTPKGCLGLGPSTAEAALGDSAYTLKVVTGLESGTTYRLTGWWDVHAMELGKVFLTVAVLGNDNVPIARKSWGALKRQYR